MCTPLIYSNDNWVGKRAHIGHTRPKNVRPAAEICAPDAKCTVNFEHLADSVTARGQPRTRAASMVGRRSDHYTAPLCNYV